MDIKAVLSQMTVAEKAALCCGKNFWHLNGVERLGIPSVMVTDGPCGLRKQADSGDHLGLNESVTAISFPTGSCVASSYDDELMNALGVTLAEECQAEDVAVILGPALNIKRSPLCGRNFEYMSEDPYLSGKLSASYIRGVQSKNVGVSPKHFAVNNQETRRMSCSSNLDERTFREIYLPGFETVVKESDPWTIMCCYNKINGVYGAANNYLLNDILRKEWGFNGYVVTDWGAIKERVECLKAGTDLEMPGTGPANIERIVKAVEDGSLTMEELDTAAGRIIDITMRYVENRQPDTKFDYERDHEFARNAAAESMVLLKNDGVLPLKKDQKIAFIGKYAEAPRFQGGGSSHVNSYKVTGAVEAAKGLDVTYAQGYITEKDETQPELLAEAVETAKNAEAAVIFIGLPDVLESEGFDRKNLDLPACQIEVINEVAKVQKNIAVVVHCGGNIVMPWLDKAGAVLYAYLGGEAVGAAVCDLIFGDKNPSGKLAETFPLKLEDNPSYLNFPGEGNNVNYAEGIFVGYRYYDKKKMEVLFPFGYGLSYTTFEYSDLKVSADEINDTDTLTVTATVENTGNVFGKEAVQLYVRNAECETARPVRELKGYAKVALKPGEKKEVTFTLDKRSFAYYNVEAKDWVVPTGLYGIEIGKSSRDIVLTADVKVNSTTVIKHVYTLDSLMGQLMADPKGVAFLSQMAGDSPFASLIGGAAASGEAPEMLGMDVMAMIRDMPLRTLFSFAGLGEEQMQGVIMMLNS